MKRSKGLAGFPNTPNDVKEFTHSNANSRHLAIAACDVTFSTLDFSDKLVLPRDAGHNSKSGSRDSTLRGFLRLATGYLEADELPTAT